MVDETIEGYVVDIACLRRYNAADTLHRARQHTTECALMGHCVEGGYALVDDHGAIRLLDTHATITVVEALREAERDRGVRLRVKRSEDEGEMQTADVNVLT